MWNMFLAEAEIQKHWIVIGWVLGIISAVGLFFLGSFVGRLFS